MVFDSDYTELRAEWQRKKLYRAQRDRPDYLFIRRFPGRFRHLLKRPLQVPATRMLLLDPVGKLANLEPIVHEDSHHPHVSSDTANNAGILRIFYGPASSSIGTLVSGVHKDSYALTLQVCRDRTSSFGGSRPILPTRHE